ncbi:hypothetical protein FOZ62_031727 [Perkinsus olseni]|uniref:Uncharacterized protein n=1 Tax=Perkinsus olseni TaxID=32597 RepID=A0A7J6NIW6_PEROL|nr:hypothetical protein FOZ62_031727 [Perkinsus olseni]
MIGYSIQSVLPALATVTMAVQTASRSKVYYSSIGACTKLYSPPADDHFMRVLLDGTNLIFEWEVPREIQFRFWLRKDGKAGIRAVLIRKRKSQAVKGSSEEIRNAFAAVNPFAHLVDEILRKFDRPRKRETCEDLIDLIESSAPEEYKHTDSKWIGKFLEDKMDEFVEKAHGWNERRTRKH